jgi:hypothetical protein
MPSEVAEIVDHLLAAWEIRIMRRHGIVREFGGLARGDYVRGAVDAVIPVAADIVVGVELVIGDASRLERPGDAEADRAGADHRHPVAMVLHLPSGPRLRPRHFDIDELG